MQFKLVSEYRPAGDQPRAIEELSDGIARGDKYQTLLGVTGSGKTFTISHVIRQANKPTLVMSHNKTLAAQLYGEFKNFFPENRTEFFISYYDYYQPESYIPSTDTYIQKDLSINEDIDRLRLRATTALLEGRKDVLIVASVSCIYGIGSPEEYKEQVLVLKRGQRISRKDLLTRLVDIYYTRNEAEFKRGTFRVRGDIVDVVPAYEDENAIRISLLDHEVGGILRFNRRSGEILSPEESVALYPAKYFVTPQDRMEIAIRDIKNELNERVKELNEEGKVLEAHRLEQRTNFDIEMMREIGYCTGIENYSRHLDQRPPGSRPSCLFDYFPKDFLLIVDESHVTVPQIEGMYNGDRQRKQTLVEYGFRLPSALDNRPMTFKEWEAAHNQVIFVSATPSAYELQKSGGTVVEQIIRPTGLLDPAIEVRPVKNQVDDLINEIRERAKKKERVLVTTLTKRMSEDLTDYLLGIGIRVRYIHSEIDALDRVEILRDLRLGNFDVLVGVNLLREGLDLPEVSLVAIIDADKEGFLRSEKSLLQTAGRTARNVNGKVILYADTITGSMDRVIKETERRRKIQQEYNEKNNINPKTIYKTFEEIMHSTIVADSISKDQYGRKKRDLKRTNISILSDPIRERSNPEERREFINHLRKQMVEAAKDLEFERAAEIRDEIKRLED
jgi:excinuclease ABC subunit B